MNFDDTILVTGGGGFVGSHLIELLVKKGYENILTVERNINESSNPLFQSIRRYEGNISDFDFIDDIVKTNNIQYIFHLAGNSNVPLSHKEPFIDFESNAKGTLNIFQSAVKNQVQKVLYASSAAVYGIPSYVPIDESHPLEPLSNYGLTKLYSDKLALAYSKTYNVPSVVARIFSIYGPRQPRYLLLDTLNKLDVDKSNLGMMGNPDTIRDYIYIDDATNILYNLMINHHSNGNAYNIGGGNPTTIENFIRIVCDILDIKPKIDFSGETWKGDILDFRADMTKTLQLLSVKKEDFTPLRKGIEETINWYYNQKNNK